MVQIGSETTVPRVTAPCRTGSQMRSWALQCKLYCTTYTVLHCLQYTARPAVYCTTVAFHRPIHHNLISSVQFNVLRATTTAMLSPPKSSSYNIKPTNKTRLHNCLLATAQTIRVQYNCPSYHHEQDPRLLLRYKNFLKKVLTKKKFPAIKTTA